MAPSNISKSAVDGAIELHDHPSPLWVPDVARLSLVDAALAYAKAGWYVLPTDPADIKNPGSVVCGQWQDKSTRDPEQIRAWWRENPGYGIALHIGKSGAIAFDLDIDDLDVIARSGRPDIAGALRSAGAIQATRCHGDRGHYVYTTAPGESFGNGPGRFKRWGQVRGRNGVITAAPTPHPDAKTKGGHYQWKRVGALLLLPDVLRACLSEAADETDPLTEAELDEFLATYTGGGCGREDCRNSPKGPVTRFNSQVVLGCSRHDTMASVLPWALSEAMGGCYSAREAVGQLHKAFAAAFTEDDDPARRSHLDNEFVRLAQWAAAHADPNRAHHNEQPQQRNRFAYRPQLARFARKRWRKLDPLRAEQQRQREIDQRPTEPATRPHEPVVQTPGGGETPPPVPPPSPSKTRFFGTATLNPEFYARDFGRITSEVIQHLAAVEGVELEVRLEITAVAKDGFDEGKVRTVSENAHTLKFEQSGFEAE